MPRYVERKECEPNRWVWRSPYTPKDRYARRWSPYRDIRNVLILYAVRNRAYAWELRREYAERKKAR